MEVSVSHCAPERQAEAEPSRPVRKRNLGIRHNHNCCRHERRRNQQGLPALKDAERGAAIAHVSYAKKPAQEADCAVHRNQSAHDGFRNLIQQHNPSRHQKQRHKPPLHNQHEVCDSL